MKKSGSDRKKHFHSVARPTNQDLEMHQRLITTNDKISLTWVQSIWS